jgi:hypothetical protein
MNQQDIMGDWTREYSEKCVIFLDAGLCPEAVGERA